VLTKISVNSGLEKKRFIRTVQLVSLNNSLLNRPVLRKILTLFLCCFFVSSAIHAQQSGDYNLGSGLVVFGGGPLDINFNESITYYTDTTELKPMHFTVEQTNCPNCMICAEPTQYYNGVVHPFLCGYQGLCFVTTNQSKNWRDIIVDSTGKKLYVKANQGVYYSWRDWMILQGKKGEYMMRQSYNDGLILYDKPYDLQHLPVPNKQHVVKLKLQNIEDLRFVPVDVKGYWVKLKVTDYWHKTYGYCWIIWRTETDWTFGFKWHAD